MKTVKEITEDLMYELDDISCDIETSEEGLNAEDNRNDIDENYITGVRFDLFDIVNGLALNGEEEGKIIPLEKEPVLQFVKQSQEDWLSDIFDPEIKKRVNQSLEKFFNEINKL